LQAGRVGFVFYALELRGLACEGSVCLHQMCFRFRDKPVWQDGGDVDVFLPREDMSVSRSKL